jgi:hypothetical protein
MINLPLRAVKQFWNSNIKCGIGKTKNLDRESQSIRINKTQLIK